MRPQERANLTVNQQILSFESAILTESRNFEADSLTNQRTCDSYKSADVLKNLLKIEGLHALKFNHVDAL